MDDKSVQQAKFDGWGIVDVFGHQRYVGYVTTEAYGQAVLFRIDVPALEERERITKRPEYVGHVYAPAGTTVKEGAVAGYTKLVGSGSIYAITPCSKDAALAAVEDMQARPLMGLQLPEKVGLPAGDNAPYTDAQLHGAGDDDNHDLNDDDEEAGL